MNVIYYLSEKVGINRGRAVGNGWGREQRKEDVSKVFDWTFFLHALEMFQKDTAICGLLKYSNWFIQP